MNTDIGVIDTNSLANQIQRNIQEQIAKMDTCAYNDSEASGESGIETLFGVIKSIGQLKAAFSKPQPNLDSSIQQEEMPCTEGANDMAKRKKIRVEVNGETKWVTGNTQQEIIEAAAKLLAQNTPADAQQKKAFPLFGKWLDDYNSTYRRKMRKTTQENYAQFIKKHIVPRIGLLRLDEINSSLIQSWFDDLCDEGYAAETIKKIRTIIKPAFDYAVSQGEIIQNPINKWVKINTTKGEHHKALPNALSQEAKKCLPDLPKREQLMMALLCYTGQRIGEVLGLRWEDIDFEKKLIHLERGVTHPDRNQPIVGEPKTENGIREIPLVTQLADLLEPYRSMGYVVSGERPLSFQQQKRSWGKIKAVCGLEGYTPHDMRDTCATEWFEAGVPIEMVSKILGHANTAITLKLYAKIRNVSYDSAREQMEKVTRVA